MQSQNSHMLIAFFWSEIRNLTKCKGDWGKLKCSITNMVVCNKISIDAGEMTSYVGETDHW